MRGFLKFLLAVALVIGGALIVLSSFLGGMQFGIYNVMAGQSGSSALFWVAGIIGFIVFLGGAYMLRKH